VAARRVSSHGLETSVLTDVALPVALGIIMFGLGLGLSAEDFRRVARTPRAIVAGLLTQVVMLPLAAMGTAVLFFYAFDLDRELILGLLLLAACPAGTTSNLVTYLARADAALSVSLTTVNSLGAALTTPLVFLATTTLLLGEGREVDVSFVEMAGLVLALVVVPVLLGVLVRRWRPGFATRSDRAFRIASAALLALVVVGVLLQNREDLGSLAAASVPASLALNLLALAGGYAMARLFRLGLPQARAVAIETGFQNGTLGIAIAITQLDSARAAIVPGFYSLVMFGTGALLAWWWARDTRLREARAANPAA
jgi:BASS family bile acid:Na+ symporter